MINRFDNSFIKCSCWVLPFSKRSTYIVLKLFLSLPLIQIPIKIYADQNGEFVFHDFKIIYKRFKSSDRGRS